MSLKKFCDFFLTRNISIDDKHPSKLENVSFDMIDVKKYHRNYDVDNFPYVHCKFPLKRFHFSFFFIKMKKILYQYAMNDFCRGLYIENYINMSLDF